MAKKQIKNYAFYPGTASSSNAYPNAYTLLINNKEFVKEESSAYIAAQIIADSNQNLYPYAVTLLTNNKEFLKDEIRAWIAAQVLASTPPFSGYTYDADKCERDVGYVLDAYIYDLRYGGNEQTTEVSKQYWLGGTAQIDGDRAPEVAAHTQLRSIINNFILPRVGYSTLQSPVVTTQNTTAPSGEAGTTSRIVTLSTILVDVIQNGLSVLPAISYSDYNFAGYAYDSDKCKRDVGYVLDAYANDLKYGGNIEIRHVSSRYWEGSTPQVDSDRKPEIVTHQFIRNLINNYIFTQAAYTPLQIIELQYTNNAITYEAGASARITSEQTILTDVIANGLDSLPAKSNGVTQLKIQGKINLDELLLITNTTNNTILYNFSSNQFGATIDYFDTYNSNGYYRDDDFPSYLQTADYVTTITLDANTSTSSSTDDIQIFVEQQEMRVRPYDFGTDAIERMRVGLPQSMIDADFEYGLQPTKWQAIGLLRSYPSTYEVPGTDTPVVTVITDASVGTANVGSSLITVTTTGPHGFIVGQAITIKALANTITGFSRAEGSFLVNTVPTTTTFTYYASAKVGTTNGQVLATGYTQLRKAEFYTGASLGVPTFSVATNGISGTLTTEFITLSGVDQIAFSGTAPSIGSPLTGTGINAGTQVSGVVGTGGISVSTSVKYDGLIGDTSIEVDDPTGILEGMAIDNGTGTSIFVSGISGDIVSLTGSLTAIKIGGTETYNNITGTDVSPIGSGAEFEFARTGGFYASVGIANGGQNYKVGDKIRLSGTDFDGASPANDIVLTVTAVSSGGSIDNADSATPFTWIGTSVTGNRVYTNQAQDLASLSGINAVFDITVTDLGDSSAGTYTVTLGSTGGTGYVGGELITIYGSGLGGGSPNNDLTIEVLTVDGVGQVLTFDYYGDATGTDKSFPAVGGTNEPQISAGAIFDITRTGGGYTVSIANGGSDYTVGNQILVLGSDVGGTSPSNDVIVTVESQSGGVIGSASGDGFSVTGDSIDFYSAISLSEVTTASIPDNTSIAFSAIALIQIAFASAHGLIPGASITVSINSAGTNHGLAAGPFFVEQVPSSTTIRYTARSAGTVDILTILTGTVYTRSDAYFIHRPYDGGVQLGTGGPQHGAHAIRMSKKYIRYQSGKGVMYTTGALFAPSYDLQSLTATGTTIGSYITIATDDVDHGCQVGATIRISGIVTAGYNGDYVITDVVNERTFRVQATTVLGNVYATLSGQSQMSLVGWHGATVRAGVFDDQNGMFWQYNGNRLSVGRRTSTFQIAGVIAISANSNLITGTSTRLRDQLQVGDKIVIKGMTHTVSSITSQTSMTVTPDYRGVSDATNTKLCKVEDFIIPQENFNIDKLDGTGPSGYNINTSTMQMIGIQYSWYGAGFIDYMLRGSDGNYVFCHRIRNSNINTEAYMRTGNLPVRYEVINESAKNKLKTSITAIATTVPLVDATDFPNESGLVIIDNELIAFTGKSGNNLTGCTRAAPLTNFVAGAQRTFTAGTATTHEYNTGVVLVSNTVSPIISHWGSAFLTDGLFDEDRGYIFSYAATNISVSTVKQTAFLIRLAPSVSNAIVGDLGDRELLNRAQLLLKGIAITSDTGTGGIVIEGVLNPQNYPINPGDISWGGLSGASQGGQPSFAQIAPGGSVSWNGGSSSTTAAVTTQANMTGTITIRNIGYWGGTRSISNGSAFFFIRTSDYNTYVTQGITNGLVISGGSFPSGTTITGFGNYGNVSGTNYHFVSTSANANADVNGDTTRTVTLGMRTTTTSTLFFQQASWVSSGATTGTEVADALFPANTKVTSAALSSFFGTSYYRVTTNQTSSSTPITPGTTTITFKFGLPPYALPGETVFSFIAAPGTDSELDLGELKELTNTTLGGRGTYPNGPDVLAINVYKAAGAAITSNIVLRWGEAQA
jgi:hypothetical protein